MAVHVGEVHTDVVGSADGAGTAVAAERSAPEPPGVADERWRDARVLADRLASRVSARGHED
jgi:hypothetical protein